MTTTPIALSAGQKAQAQQSVQDAPLTSAVRATLLTALADYERECGKSKAIDAARAWLKAASVDNNAI